jgi:hypothetical protein
VTASTRHRGLGATRQAAAAARVYNPCCRLCAGRAAIWMHLQLTHRLGVGAQPLAVVGAVVGEREVEAHVLRGPLQGAMHLRLALRHLRQAGVHGLQQGTTGEPGHLAVWPTCAYQCLQRS